jgi:hypothetical protein
MTSTSPLSQFEVSIRVGRKIHVWQRFAVNAQDLLASVQRACEEEFLGRPFKILDWRETASRPTVGAFIHVPAWQTEGMVIQTRPAQHGTDDAIEVLLQTRPNDPRPRWYHLEPGQYTILEHGECEGAR